MSLQVFISYKSEYRDFARKVKDSLRQWGYATWLDVENIPKGAYWPDEIDNGLLSSDVMVGVMNKDALESRPVKREWDYFLFHKEEERLLLIKQGDCNPPPRFIMLQHIDFIKDEAEGLRQLQSQLAKVAAEVKPSTSLEQKPEPQPAADVLSALPATDTTDAKKRDEVATAELFGTVTEEGGESLHELAADEANLAADKDEEVALATNVPADSPPSVPVGTAFLPSAPLPSPIAPPAAAPPREPPKPAPVAAPITPAMSAPSPQPAALPASPSLYTERGQGGEVLMPAAARKSGARLPVWALGSIAAVLVAVIGAVILFSSANSLPTNLTQPQPATSPLLLLLGVLVVSTVGVFAWRRYRGAPVGAAVSVSPVTELANRHTMLDKVEEFWIRGVLDKALEAGQFEMGLAAAPGAVLRHVDYGDYPLPADASILGIFNDLNRELLILGAPGGGKTVLLLQLARELIAQARKPLPVFGEGLGRGTVPPIPVVFNLSSWAAERKPLADWLVDELRLKYQVPKKVAQSWVEREQILPLLDGLDEVADQYRNDCVEAINAFRQQYRAVDVAVCSRLADYDLLTSKLDVRGAVTLQPLDDDQINRYLDRPDLNGLRQVMTTDTELRDMTHIPFLLNTMAYAYAGASVNSLQLPRSDDMGKARRAHLFDRLVEKRLAANPDAKYASKQVRKWLAWLARKMTQFKQTTLYIEGLQPGWLSFPKHVLLIFCIIQLILLPYYVFRLTSYSTELQVSLFSFVGLSFFITAIYFLVAYFPIKRHSDRSTLKINIRASEKITWSWSFPRFVVGLVIGYLVGFYIILRGDLLTSIPMAIIIALFGLYRGQEIAVKTRPNQGIWLSTQNSIRVFLIPIIALNILFILFVLINGQPYDVSVYGLLGANYMIGIYFSFPVSLLLYGGLAVLQHLILRLIIWRSGDAPLNYARFLDYCASAGLLRKVGGGYIFVHRYLLEYFAGLE